MECRWFAVSHLGTTPFFVQPSQQRHLSTRFGHVTAISSSVRYWRMWMDHSSSRSAGLGNRYSTFCHFALLKAFCPVQRGHSYCRSNQVLHHHLCFVERPRKMGDSPFCKKKTAFSREKTFWESNVVESWEAAKAVFVDAIPSDDVKRLPPSYIYVVGSVIFVMLAAIFIAVFVPGS
jgi:hypothetical protein